MGDRLLMLLNPQHGQFFKIACECLQGSVPGKVS